MIFSDIFREERIPELQFNYIRHYDQLFEFREITVKTGRPTLFEKYCPDHLEEANVFIDGDIHYSLKNISSSLCFAKHYNP